MIRYGNIEGVAWITRTRVAVVSDRRKKKNQPDENLSEKDQSIHIFDIPSEDGCGTAPDSGSIEPSDAAAALEVQRT
jgi:hypothetical protein